MDNNTDLIFAPLDYPELLPETTSLEFWLRITESGLINPVGVLTNMFAIICMIGSKLHTDWTYGMLLNTCIAECIICITSSLAILPAVIAKR